MSTIHLPLQRPAPGPASADAAPAGDPAWSRVLLVAGSRAALAVVLSLVVWSVLPAALGWSPRVIMSGSMMPRIHVGDVVVDRQVDPSVLTEGRIVTVTDPDHPEKTRTHRFLRLDEAGRLVTQGDANDAPDSTPVDPDDVLGLAALRVPYVGLPVTWMAQGQLAPVGITVTVLLLLGLAATTPLRFADPDDEDDAPDEDTTDDAPDDRDAGLGILGADAERRRADLRARAPRRGGRVVTRSARAVVVRRPRLLGLAGAALGALLATGLTTQATYAALSSTASNPTTSFAAAALFDAGAYPDAVRADGPLLYWRMDEPSGATVADAATGAADPGTLRGSFTRGSESGLPSEPSSRSTTFAAATLVEDNPTSAQTARFTVEAWIRTISTAGGLVVGLGNTGGATAPTTVDRVLFLSPDGRLRLGVDGRVLASSRAPLNDGRWHHVAGVLDGNGNLDATLYVDGQSQGPGLKGKPALNNGHWRVGGGSLTGYPNAPAGAGALAGMVDEVAVYGTALAVERIQAHYATAWR
ncbi:signal peptidase I [Nocardioides aurantiacus]|uniref:Signal peptidase I n=1 Tax=Nocardioides aurantiacus TaxID=86796 RepID=A0A3N2CP13_9ACTN|nr:signal peptidase I [Nocardioides aurantiacus]ROR89260.1 signal peptidase I [Nocardioides aurantiacus]